MQNVQKSLSAVYQIIKYLKDIAEVLEI
jgi:hypothetical protein